MHEKKVLKGLVLSSLLAIGAVTAVQAEAVHHGETATAEEGSVAVGIEAYARNGGIAIGNKVSTTDKDATYSHILPANIAIGNQVYTVKGATDHGIGIGSDVTYGQNSVGIGTNINAGTMNSIVIGNNAKTTDGSAGIAIGLNAAAGLNAIAMGPNSAARFSSLALGENANAGAYHNAVALGSNSAVTRGALAASAKTTNSTTASIYNIYADNNVSDDDKAAIKDTVKGRLGPVSVGSDKATRQIINVAAGTAASDAVNVAQLKSVDNRLTAVNTELSGRIDSLDGRVDSVENKIQDIKNTGNNNTTEINNIKTDVENQGKIIGEHTNQINDLDGRVTNNTNAINDLTDRVSNHDTAISGLNNRVDKLGTRVNKIGAGAAALAGLHPLDFDDDSKLTFAAGFGAYKNQQAAALGAFYRPNENLMFSFATAVGNSENMYNAGLSFRFGDSSPYQGLSKAELVSALEDQGKDIEVLKAKANEVDTVKAENAALNERLAKLEALLAAR